MKNNFKICCVYFFAIFSGALAIVCNNVTEWTCPATQSTPSKCIPIAYKCDNVNDCGPQGLDETMECAYPQTLSDFRVEVAAHSLKQTTFEWSTSGDRFTNVTVNITYTDGEKGETSTLAYASRRRCFDMRPDMCPEKVMCSVMPMTKVFCKKTCEVCRRDSVWKRAYFDMLHLLERNATNIRARGYASNYRGDGPSTPFIDVPVPEITPVSNLTVRITKSWVDDVWAILSWNNSRFIQKPNFYGSDKNIQHIIKLCSIVESPGGPPTTTDCKTTQPVFPEKMKEKFYGLKYGRKYMFTVQPVYRYYEKVSAPGETVYLVVPPKQDEYRVNPLAVACGVGGAIFVIIIVFMVFRKYRARHANDGYSAKYGAAPT